MRGTAVCVEVVERDDDEDEAERVGEAERCDMDVWASGGDGDLGGGWRLLSVSERSL